MIPWYLFSRFHSFSFLSSVGRISNGLLGRSLRSFATFVRSHRSLAPFMGSLTHSANSLIGLLKFMDMCTRWKHVSWEQSEFLIVSRNTPKWPNGSPLSFEQVSCRISFDWARGTFACSSVSSNLREDSLCWWWNQLKPTILIRTPKPSQGPWLKNRLKMA